MLMLKDDEKLMLKKEEACFERKTKQGMNMFTLQSFERQVF